MSSLTKLFVILLVIFSLLNAAATVVFVNQVGDLGKKLEQGAQRVSSMEIEKNAAQSAVAAAQANVEQVTSQAASEMEKGRQAVNQAQQRMNDLGAQNADLTSQLALKSADSTRLTEAVKAAQDMTAKQAEMITALRTTNDERLKQNVELNTELTAKINELQVTERERRYAVEQLTETKRTVDKQTSMIRDAGINPTMMNTGATTPINGVVRSMRTFAGVPYASISVGSNDGVTKGMEFKVVDRGTGDFLGVLTVDSVEPTESTGRLSGPSITRIKPGVEVKTQL